MPVAAFGVAAQLYAARFPADLDIVFADETLIGDALAEGVDRARTGRRFFGALAIVDPRSIVAQRLAPRVLEAVPDLAQRRSFCDAIAVGQLTIDGRNQSEFGINADTLSALRCLAMLCDSLIVRSWVEDRWLRANLGTAQVHAVRAVVPPLVPVPSFKSRSGSRTIVVWGPERTASELAMFAFAYEELHAPVVIVCDAPPGATLFSLRAKFVGRAEAQQHLESAAVIVDASIGDPAAAIELAKGGVPVVASTYSGANEYIDGVCTYDPWNFRSILAATLMGLGANPPKLRAGIPGLESLGPAMEAARPLVPERTPLVSIVIPTKDRRGVLPRAIESVANQTYPNVEIIVVNDGGPPVDDLVAYLPNARVVNHEVNLGVTPSLNDGIAVARGEYIGFLGDDDYIYADHLMRLVGALERSGGSVGHAFMFSSYLDPNPDGYYDLIGHNLLAQAAIDPTELMANNIVGGTSVLYHRRIFDELGPMDLAPKQGADFELYLRILQRHDFIMVPRVTANVDFRRDQSNISAYKASENVAILNYLYAKYPVPGRIDLEQSRQRIMQAFASPAGDPTIVRPHRELSSPRRRQYRLQDGGPAQASAGASKAPDEVSL
ncbi:MAG TPA: glycosyltransferase family 2 protein [Candidatus Binatia bacterium]|nr:glycosyltransferase family 2 protein [Candidatus Binatia bacterium]